MRNSASIHHKSFSVERLECRRVLSAVSVTNNSDVVNGDVSSVEALVANPGEDGILLREAIEATNATTGPDEIGFELGHEGPETVVLTGELQITDDLTLRGPNAGLLAIDADNQGRVLNVNDGDAESAFSLHLSGISIRGGATEIDLSAEFNSRIGGGIYNAETLTLSDVVVHRNKSSLGGGIFNDGNGVLRLLRSRVEENESSTGGGIVNRGTASIINSVVSKNVAESGGGIVEMGELFLVNSHVTHNTAAGNGLENGHGGIYVSHYFLYGDLHSTNSIIANNAGGDVWAVPADHHHDHAHSHFYGVNIVSDASETGLNILNVDPILDENGVPRPGSPAIDAAVTSLAADQEDMLLRWDIRGEGHHRVLGYGVDIGAFEASGFLPGDSNQDGDVDFDDFLQLTKNFGKIDAAWEDGDFDGNGDVTFGDFLVLAANFGAKRQQALGSKHGTESDATPVGLRENMHER